MEFTKLRTQLIAISAVFWLVSWYLNAWIFSIAQFTPGISLVYLPAGIRLIIVLVFGVWGAVGIAIVDPLLFATDFGPQPLLQSVLNALISGFVPLLTVHAFARLLAIGSELTNLKPAHLPVLALAVSFTTPLAFNIQFLSNGLETGGEFAKNLSAMMLGDFLGCMVAFIALRVVILIYRRHEALNRSA